jgi:ribosomal protein S18 acetylase RimI-like enzyme
MLTPRAGNINDSEFISACLLSGARKGLFAVDVDKSECVRLMQDEVRSILSRNRAADGVPAQTLVYSEKGERIGFVIVVSRSKADMELELYAIAVAHRHRGKGFGARMLDDVLKNFDYKRFYARCSGNSVMMQRMLEKRAFRQIDTNELGFSIMVRDHLITPPRYYSGVSVSQVAGQ